MKMQYPKRVLIMSFCLAAGFSIKGANINLSSLNGNNGFTVKGQEAHETMGNAVSGAGDINGDGIADFIMGAALHGFQSEGISYVVFGKKGLPKFSPSWSVSTLTGANGFAFQGYPSTGGRFGFSVSDAGDVNDDGIGDIIVGQPLYDDVYFQGGAAVLFGRINGFPALVDWSVWGLQNIPSTEGFFINGELADARAGFSVSGAGDVNADGVADVLVGAPEFSLDVNLDDKFGRCYVVFGRSDSLPSFFELKLIDGKNGFAITGNSYNGYLGWSVSDAGDVNGDGFSDIVIGAPALSGPLQQDVGKIHVVFGSEDPFPADLNVSQLNGANGFTVSGDVADQFSLFGFSVSGAGDVNGDGVDDLIVGAPHASPNGMTHAGRCYIIFGRNGGGSAFPVFPASFSVTALGSGQAVVINGKASGDECGYSVSHVGDFNSDKIDDILIGARLADPNVNWDCGQSYVLFGQTNSFPATFDLAQLGQPGGAIKGHNINGKKAADWSGYSVSAAGDINDDGRDDILIGAPYADPWITNFSSFQYPLNKAGECYIVYGYPLITIVNGNNLGSATIAPSASGQRGSTRYGGSSTK